MTDQAPPSWHAQPGRPRRCWCTAARCARPSARRRRRCSSPSPSSTTPPSRPRPASRTRTRASSIRASPTRPRPCSRSACACWKAPRPARATATGMAAVTSALLCFLKAGDHIVAARAMFGSCLYVAQDLCPRFGIALHAGRRPRHGSLAAGGAPEHARPSSSRRRPTRRSTSSTSPRCREIAHAAGAIVIVDNVFATPLLQKPLKLGADVVVYSATKHIDGQGRCLGGVDAVLAAVPQGPPAHLPAPDRARRSARSTPG